MYFTKEQIIKKLKEDKEFLENRKIELQIQSVGKKIKQIVEEDDDYFTGDYYSIIDNLSYINEQIEILKDKINLIKNAPKKKIKEKVTYGDLILVKDGGKTSLFCLTDNPKYVDIQSQIISIFSNLGKIIDGHKYGDKIVFNNKDYKILPAF